MLVVSRSRNEEIDVYAGVAPTLHFRWNVIKTPSKPQVQMLLPALRFQKDDVVSIGYLDRCQVLPFSTPQLRSLNFFRCKHVWFEAYNFSVLVGWGHQMRSHFDLWLENVLPADGARIALVYFRFWTVLCLLEVNRRVENPLDIWRYIHVKSMCQSLRIWEDSNTYQRLLAHYEMPGTVHML